MYLQSNNNEELFALIIIISKLWSAKIRPDIASERINFEVTTEIKQLIDEKSFETCKWNKPRKHVQNFQRVLQVHQRNKYSSEKEWIETILPQGKGKSKKKKQEGNVMALMRLEPNTIHAVDTSS